jgi:hypothetical protein
MASHTRGPWGWFGTDHGVYLATKHSGRRFVMGFRRLGMNGAQPTFQVERKGMIPASELVQFEVGNKAVRGFAEAKKDATVYRYDVVAIDHPDARLIAAAPDMLEALKELLKLHEAHHNNPVHAAARAAIRKAEGEP